VRAAGLLMTALLLLGGEAQARDRRAASAHFQQGSALYADGRWSDALAEFQAGYEAYPLRGFLVNIGQCYRKLERFDDAADAWRRFLASHPSDAQLRAEVEEALAEVERAREAETPKETTPPPVETAPVVETHVSVVPPPVEQVDLTPPPPPVARKKSRAWVWALVGVAAAGVAAAAVTVGVVESQNSGPRSGSLGLIDGRR
jgi:iron complex outermembrane recepter protein